MTRWMAVLAVVLSLAACPRRNTAAVNPMPSGFEPLAVGTTANEILEELSKHETWWKAAKLTLSWGARQSHEFLGSDHPADLAASITACSWTPRLAAMTCDLSDLGSAQRLAQYLGSQVPRDDDTGKWRPPEATLVIHLEDISEFQQIEIELQPSRSGDLSVHQIRFHVAGRHTSEEFHTWRARASRRYGKEGKLDTPTAPPTYSLATWSLCEAGAAATLWHWTDSAEIIWTISEAQNCGG